MKLWLLKPAKNLQAGDNPWVELYYRVIGFVIRAASENEARQIAHENGESETPFPTWISGKKEYVCPWLENRYSSCIELTSDGTTEVIMKYLHTA